MLKEFKEFISKGNVMDLAVGVIIGAAFQAIVSSLVNDIVMPLISIITGSIDFSDMAITVGGANLKYGNFITSIINFLIISFVIFLMVRYMNRLNKRSKENLAKISNTFGLKKNKEDGKEENEPEPETKLCPYCLSEIPYKATKCAHCASDLEEKHEHVTE